MSLEFKVDEHLAEGVVKAKEESFPSIRLPDCINLPDGFGFPTSLFSIPPCYRPFLKSVLVPHGMMVDRIEALAERIAKVYSAEHKKPHCICLLKGAARFHADLLTALGKAYSTTSTELDRPFSSDYMRVSSYSGTHSTGQVKISGIDLESLKDKHVLLVEDIVDTGNTLMKLLPTLQEAGVASVKVAVLFHKRVEGQKDVPIDFLGFSIANEFIVGYNIDYNDRFRDMNHLCIVNADGVEAFKKV